MSSELAAISFSFGPFLLRPSQRELLADGAPVRLGSRAMGLLLALVKAPGEVVDKNTLIASVWPDTVVDSAALRVHMAALRRTLGEGLENKRYIATVPQRGYSFVMPVTKSDESSSSEVLPISARVTPSNLPTAQHHLLGRCEEVATLAKKLPLQRCVTIVGPGGIGKTSVAVAVAYKVLPSYRDGAYFIDLAPLADAGLLAETVLSELGVFAETSGTEVETLIQALRGKAMLLVLDNCEHLIEGVASLVEILLQIPTLHILITSREGLRIRGEWLRRLDSLPVPPEHVPENVSLSIEQIMQWPATQLFVERCSVAIGGFVLEEHDVATVIDICRRLDGIPLAIELAAARVEQFGLMGLANVLDERLKVLGRGWRNAPPRHQTLRATLDWSYDRLDIETQILFQQISQLTGNFTLGEANAVCEHDAFEGLSELAAKSLLTSDVKGGVTRYRLLETTRLYAAEKLQERITAGRVFY